MFFLHLLRGYDFHFHFVYLVYHIDWSVNIEPSLHPLEQISLDHRAWSFGCMIELCFLILCGGFLSLCLSEIFLVWFWYQNLVGLIKWVWQCSFLLLLEESEKVLPLHWELGFQQQVLNEVNKCWGVTDIQTKVLIPCNTSLSLSFLHTQTHTPIQIYLEWYAGCCLRECGDRYFKNIYSPLLASLASSLCLFHLKAKEALNC